MFLFKKRYYLIIENTKDINLKNIKKRNKFVIIYRNNKNLDDLENLFKFRKLCKLKSIEFFVANNARLAVKLNSDGIYLSSYNKSLKLLSLKKRNFKIIGSAHSNKEIFMKTQQGCEIIVFSKLFQVNYDKKAPFLGIVKFNNLLNINKGLIPLGGIKSSNLNSLQIVKSESFVLKSEIKKKPANIINRLFWII